MARPDELHAGGVSSAAGFTFTVSDGSQAQVINLLAQHEVHAWTHALGCTEERLRMAIAAVGPELQEVCDHLGALLPAQPLSLAAGNGTAH